uniref:Uncharacterized protein n=1 Tax=Oryza sativa subsp. japonica TaxID=39947 RepID=Q6ETW3_ORYSJ|nr:hypothetical protein [Oryza sativa Japonica Group]
MSVLLIPTVFSSRLRPRQSRRPESSIRRRRAVLRDLLQCTVPERVRTRCRVGGDSRAGDATSPRGRREAEMSLSGQHGMGPARGVGATPSYRSRHLAPPPRGCLATYAHTRGTTGQLPGTRRPG